MSEATTDKCTCATVLLKVGPICPTCKAADDEKENKVEIVTFGDVSPLSPK